MAEYYCWVNVDKKEYLVPADFDYGNKFRESIHKDSIPLHALHTLLNKEWMGDHVVWLGDESFISDQSINITLQKLLQQSLEFGETGCTFGDPGYVDDMVIETYRNVSCLFQEAEEEVRQEIYYDLEDLKTFGEFHNQYGIDPDKPFEGLFSKRGKRYEYVLNHTKKIYYSLNETVILFQDHTVNNFSDPLPILMGYGRVTEPGEWLGDIIGVSDQRPEGYSLLREIYLDW